MKIGSVRDILGARLLCGEQYLEDEILSVCGSDLMSDVLAFVKEQSLLLTGLVNPQVVRTAEMMDMKCIVFVRGKEPDASILELAENHGIAVLSCPLRMFTACGRLYVGGLKGEDA